MSSTSSESNSDWTGGWPVIVTAPDVSPKAMNTLLLRMYDFNGPDVPCPWMVLRDTKLEHPLFKPTHAPVPDRLLAHNDFAGYSIADVNAWLCDPENEESLEADKSLSSVVVIVDAKGLANGTVVVLEKEFRDDDDAEDNADKLAAVRLDAVRKFEAVRLPFEDVPSLVCNLWIANMNISEWWGCEDVPDEDGVYTMNDGPGHEPVTDPAESGELGRELAEKGLLEDLPNYKT